MSKAYPSNLTRRQYEFLSDMIPEAKLGAYRDNEVSPAHPFILTVEDLKKTGKTSIMPLMQFKSILKTTKIL
ncbi:hypothetical protein G7B40_020875 [Aetokthonos hydrillicola Thurmond2011]|uniref:Uncharacterized protein n=1 Tax=Aetokthonos hydrillicola Thurmond2011 TaxID=2712845 RepID=A0AAP5I8U5_9CYAN|nr:hypothetical protein [Aetokthonos hydrillicola]MDR9897001.1 hypothetical protein [Aetokthonos hydrillicola Thurmond2011]